MKNVTEPGDLDLVVLPASKPPKSTLITLFKPVQPPKARADPVVTDTEFTVSALIVHIIVLVFSRINFGNNRDHQESRIILE